jgi:hypothetical protein
MDEKASSGDPVLDDIVARFDAGTLTVEEAVTLYARNTNFGLEIAATVVALALGAEWEEGYEDQLGPIPTRGKAAEKDEQAALTSRPS